MNAVIESRRLASVSKETLREFVAAGSTEVTPHDEPKLAEYARVIPGGYRVYVAHTPKATLDDVVRVALTLRSLGLAPTPHIVARRVRSAEALRHALDRLVAHGIREILLIAGDRAAANGPYGDTLRILDTRMTVEAGITRIGVAGHPEGHPCVPEPELWAALAQKQAFGRATGTQMHIATQFGFDARALAFWEQELASRGIALPIHAGVAGPAPLVRLLEYAVRCGVGASLKAVRGNLMSFSRLPHLVTQADEMLIGVLLAKQRTPDSRIFAPHFFAFGGVLKTARWLRALVEGSFELDPARHGFSMNN
jgi:methylenetetrahydrofolate reductase (NADPH)